MKQTTLTCLTLLCSGLYVSGQVTFPRNGAYDERAGRYAFTHATLVTDPGTVLQDATLLIENGLVIAAGGSVAIPEGTVVTDLKGNYIYPSFIDLHAAYGMPESSAPPRTAGRAAPQLESQKKGVYGWNQAIHAEQSAAALFAVQETKAAALRKAGFGTVLSHLQDGIVRGTGALVTLHTGPAGKAVLKSEASAHFSFSKGTSTQNYPTSAMGAVALLRQTYYDADWYEKGGKAEETNLSLEAFNRIKKLPSFFEAGDKWALLRADNTGKEFGVQYILKGKGDEYQRMDAIKQRKVSLIIPLNFPETYDVSDAWDAEVVTLAELKHWELAPANAAFLAEQEIPFAFTATGLKNPSDFLDRLRTAVAYGLPKEKALEALTTTPARLIRAGQQVGALKKGFIANFLITSGDLFDKETVLYENWVQGTPYIVRNMHTPDLRGTYAFTLNDQPAGRLQVGGSRSAPDYQLVLQDSTRVTPRVAVVNELFSMTYSAGEHTNGTIRLTGWLGGGGLTGSGELADGTPVTWKAALAAPFTAPPAREEPARPPEGRGNVWYPFTGLGGEQLPVQVPILVKNTTVWTNEQEGLLTGTDVLVQNGKISRIGKSLPIPTGTQVIDGTGKHLTSGIIDEHSHIALFSVNEGSQSSSAEVRMSDVINPDDVNIYRQLAGGVTTAQLLHGSANAIGGQSAVIKLKWGASPEALWLPEARSIKFALGENVKQSNWGDAVRVRYPQTRMGVEQVYYDHFIRAREYDQAWKRYNALSNKSGARAPRRDLELDALAEILHDKRFITCHSYVQSEINMLMSVADSLKFRINTFTHILEGYKLADKMAARNIGGSAFADWWAYKMEVKEAIPYNAALMAREGVVVSINSDDAEMARRLNQEAGKVVNFGGMTEEEAWKMVTLNPAKLLRLDDRLGSIKPGKDGDLVLWNNHPLSIYARPEYTIIDGAIYFSREEDALRRARLTREKARLIQKSLEAKSKGAPTQSPQSRMPRMWHCEDITGEDIHQHEGGER